MGNKEDTPIHICQLFASPEELSEPPIVFQPAETRFNIYTLLRSQSCPLVWE
jgi:hypothetical protein